MSYYLKEFHGDPPLHQHIKGQLLLQKLISIHYRIETKANPTITL